jgi:hypothetical protein
MKILLALCMLFVLAFTGAAQDATETAPEPSPFLRALSLIADVPSVQDGAPVVSYGANHEALLARGLPIPANWEFFEFLGAPPAILFSLSGAGMSDMSQTLWQGGPEFSGTIGLDFFQIAQTIEVGLPPTHGQILLGTFDAEAVIAAHQARGYTVESESEAGMLLCPADGCESGQKVRVTDVDPSNPFGGRLGQMRPLFVGDGVIVVAGDFAVLQDLIAPLTEDAASLADLPEYQALANTLAANPLVSAVMVFTPADLQPEPAPDDDAQAVLDANPLPPFELFAVASAADADAQNEDGLALLVYTDAADAETAAASIDARMALTSARRDRVYSDIFGEFGTLEPAQVVTDEATGLSVVVLRASGERPPAEDENGRTPLSHRAFMRFTQSVYMRDTLWLSTE